MADTTQQVGTHDVRTPDTAGGQAEPVSTGGATPRSLANPRRTRRN